jgi:hypothetical protein
MDSSLQADFPVVIFASRSILSGSPTMLELIRTLIRKQYAVTQARLCAGVSTSTLQRVYAAVYLLPLIEALDLRY